MDCFTRLPESAYAGTCSQVTYSKGLHEIVAPRASQGVRIFDVFHDLSVKQIDTGCYFATTRRMSTDILRRVHAVVMPVLTVVILPENHSIYLTLHQPDSEPF